MKVAKTVFVIFITLEQHLFLDLSSYTALKMENRIGQKRTDLLKKER